MEFTVRQFLAWVLIVIGLGIVFWDISSSYYYFTAQKEFPKVFTENTSSITNNSTGTTIEGQIGNVIKDQIKQLIPENTVTQLLNISSWMLFASFLLWAGGKLIGIGNDFLKISQNGNR
jgi:hypothetical protein